MPDDNLQAPNLLAPLNNTECLGTVLPSDEIRVLFDWEDVEGVGSYTLVYVDTVSDEVVTEQVGTSSITLDLQAGTLYRWYIEVNNGLGNINKSQEFSFYTQGLAFGNHVPFPAVLTIGDNVEGNTTLSWQATDLDGDLDYYQIFFSTEDPPTEIIASTLENSVEQQVNAGLRYTLVVRAYDENGNFSESEVSRQF